MANLIGVTGKAGAGNARRASSVSSAQVLGDYHRGADADDPEQEQEEAHQLVGEAKGRGGGVRDPGGQRDEEQPHDGEQQVLGIDGPADREQAGTGDRKMGHGGAWFRP